jgi:anti-sigma B factor antagonist
MAEGASQLHIEERRADDVTILVLTGEMIVDDGDLAFGRKITKLIEGGQLKILLDLAGVGQIDSSSVGMIVAKAKVVRAGGGDMKLIRLTNRTQRLLSMMKLTPVFETFEDEDAAVRSFARDPGGEKS